MFLTKNVLYPKAAILETHKQFKPGVSNSIYLGAARGRVWVRLGRIRFSTKSSRKPPRSFLSLAGAPRRSRRRRGT